MVHFTALVPALTAAIFFSSFASAAASVSLQIYSDSNCNSPNGGPREITEQCVLGGPNQGGSFRLNNILIPGGCGLTVNFDNDSNCGLGVGGPPSLTITPNDFQCFQNTFPGNLAFVGLFCN